MLMNLQKVRLCPGAYFSDAQVEGVVPALGVHLLSQQPVGLDHDERVGRLHGEQEVVVVVLAADVRKLKRALHLHAKDGMISRPLHGAASQVLVGALQFGAAVLPCRGCCVAVHQEVSNSCRQVCPIPKWHRQRACHAYIGWQGCLHTGLHACPVHVHWCYTELDKSDCQPQDSFTSLPACRLHAC